MKNNILISITLVTSIGMTHGMYQHMGLGGTQYESKRTQSQMKSDILIHMPKELGTVEAFDLDDMDSLSKTSFKKLIEASHELTEPLLLAQVITQNLKNGTLYFSYYNAHGLNKILFGESYPITVTHSHKALRNLTINTAYNDPMRNLPILSIHYYIYRPENKKAGFSYFCSHYQLFAEEENHFLQEFYAHQNDDLSLKIKALNALIPFYRKTKQCAIIIKHLAIIEKHENLIAFPDLAIFLGYTYKNGSHGISKDYKKALQYFSLAEYSSNPGIQADASAQKGIISYIGGYGVSKNYTQARDIFIPVADQAYNASAQADALRYLGIIYYEGGYGIEQCYQTAVDYLTRATQQSTNLSAQAYAALYLGIIYYEGGYGIAKNYSKSRKFLTQALQTSSDSFIQINAETYIEEIEKKEKAMALALAANILAQITSCQMLAWWLN